MTTVLKVLLVDDEKEFVDVLAMRLRMRKFDVTVVYGGKEAIEAITNSKPDVIVLDMKMPCMGGSEVVRWIKSYAADLPIIILTGYSSETDTNEVLSLGVVDILRKPPEITQLLKTIKCACSTSE